MSYHNDMISVILRNKVNLEWALMMFDTSVESDVNFDRGDFDILVRGTDCFTGEHTVAVVEVKGNLGLVSHFYRKQLPKYREQFPNGKHFVVYGDCVRKDLNFDNFIFVDAKDLEKKYDLFD